MYLSTVYLIGGRELGETGKRHEEFVVGNTFLYRISASSQPYLVPINNRPAL